MNRPSVPPKTRRILWSESMGHCMNPDCHESLFQQDSYVGELAHIRPNAAGGDVTDDNLIVLCRNCHKAIDGNSSMWPEKVLRRWKAERNQEIRERFETRFTEFAELSSALSLG